MKWLDDSFANSKAGVECAKEANKMSKTQEWLDDLYVEQWEAWLDEQFEDDEKEFELQLLAETNRQKKADRRRWEAGL